MVDFVDLVQYKLEINAMQDTIVLKAKFLSLILHVTLATHPLLAVIQLALVINVQMVLSVNKVAHHL